MIRVLTEVFKSILFLKDLHFFSITEKKYMMWSHNAFLYRSFIKITSVNLWLQGIMSKSTTENKQFLILHLRRAKYWYIFNIYWDWSKLHLKKFIKYVIIWYRLKEFQATFVCKQREHIWLEWSNSYTFPSYFYFDWAKYGEYFYSFWFTFILLYIWWCLTK